MAIVEGKPAGIARQKQQPLHRPPVGVDPHQLAAARFQQPQGALMPAWRVGHGEPLGDDGIIADVHHHPAIPAEIAPALHHIRARHRRGVAGMTVAHGQTVEMAAVLRHQGGDEARLPHRREARLLRHGGHQIHAGGDEQQAPIGLAHHVVDVELAGGPGHPRHIQPIGFKPRRPRPLGEGVHQPPDLKTGGEMETAGVGGGPKAHGAVEAALVDRKPPIGPVADEEQLAGAVGGDRQREPPGGEEGAEAAGTGDAQDRLHAGARG